MADKLRVIIVRENLRESIIADCLSFGFLLSALYLNNAYLGNSMLANVFIVFSLYGMMYRSGSSKIKRMDKQQAYEYLKQEIGE